MWIKIISLLTSIDNSPQLIFSAFIRVHIIIMGVLWKFPPIEIFIDMYVKYKKKPMEGVCCRLCKFHWIKSPTKKVKCIFYLKNLCGSPILLRYEIQYTILTYLHEITQLNYKGERLYITYKPKNDHRKWRFFWKKVSHFLTNLKKCILSVKVWQFSFYFIFIFLHS